MVWRLATKRTRTKQEGEKHREKGGEERRAGKGRKDPAFDPKYPVEGNGGHLRGGNQAVLGAHGAARGAAKEHIPECASRKSERDFDAFSEG